MANFDELVEEIKKDYVSPKSLDLKMKKIKTKDADGNESIEDGNPYCTRYNIHQIIAYHHRFDDLFWDDFSMGIIYDGRSIQDHDLTEIVIWMERVYKITTTEDILKKIVLLVARNRSKNLLEEYLDSFITDTTKELMGWDGVPRLSGLLGKYFGCKPILFEDEDGNTKDLVEIYSKKWMIGTISRALYSTVENPIKHDVVLILMGSQGIRKSSALEALTMKNKWFSDEELDLTSKDAKYSIQGKLIYELAEWSGRGKNIQREKRFFSSKTDRYRPVHGTFQIEVPRRCSFVVSTNRKSLLNDSTGSRRYWALVCGEQAHEGGWDGHKIPVEAISKVAPQMWLEARYLAKQNHQHWLTDDEEELRIDTNTEFASVHPWFYRVQEIVLGKDEIKIKDIMMMMDLKTSERTPKSKTIIEMCLKQLHYSKKRRGPRGERYILWVKE